MDESVFGKERDTYYMNKALELASLALQEQEVPIGAVVVDQSGNIRASGYNQVEQCATQTAHAELQALAKAAKINNNWRLDGCWLFVTLEPCTMCMGLIRLSRVAGVVYAASSPLFGYRLDTANSSRVYKKDIPQIVSGVCQQQAAELLQTFFKRKRIEKGECNQKKSRED